MNNVHLLILHQVISVMLILSIITNDKVILSNMCSSQTDMDIFHCSHKRLTEIPSFIHENTRELDLSHNLIEILHEDSFTRLRNVHKLILGYNRIYKITERAFLPIADTLTWLDLRFNQLTSTLHTPFPIAAFSQVVHVNYLDLTGNALGFLPAGFLYHMGRSLNHLEFSSIPTRIHMESNTFNGLSQLHHLNFANNTFANLMEEALRGLRPEHFSYLNLEGVKWICDCQILWFRRWLSRLPRKALYFNSKPGGECSSPPQYQNMALMYLNLTSLQCQPELMNTVPTTYNTENTNLTDHIMPVHVYGLQGHNLTLVCSFVSEPKMQIQWFHNGILIQPHWSRVVQTISPGIKFTTTLYFEQLDKIKDEGQYRCQASNLKGAASATFYVHVQTSVEQNDQLQSYNNKPNYDEQVNQVFNPVIIIICIVLFNIAFIIIGLFTLKCVYNKHMLSQNQVMTASGKKLKSDTEAHNVDYNPPVVENHLSCAGNSLQLSAQIDPDPINNKDFSTNMVYLPSELCCENLSHVQMKSMTQPVENKMFDRNAYLTDGILNDNNNQNTQKSVLQTKLVHHFMKQETPSPQSSDMGYLTSNASQNCDSLLDCGSNCVESLSSAKQPKPKSYYTLGVRSRSRSPELIYFLNTLHEKQPISYPKHSECSMLTGSLLPKCIAHSAERHSYHHQYTSKSQSVNSNTQAENGTLTNQASCPIHGLIHRNKNDSNLGIQCVIHSPHNKNKSHCPIHGNRNLPNPMKSDMKYKVDILKPYSENSNKYSSLKLEYSNKNLMECIKTTSLNGRRSSMKNLWNIDS
ncbi:unnamed protein product [Heterobilharzia americana]|nr:unnamed protein product [Heterobilharzia americana]CAH8577418.1 unnamed protein product [Heterobilharzia americana]